MFTTLDTEAARTIARQKNAELHATAYRASIARRVLTRNPR